MARFLVGIDLGTTNSAVAFVDRQQRAKSGVVKLQPFPITQVVAAGQVEKRPLLPSFLYLPSAHDLPAGAIALPWCPDATDVVGVFARNHGAKVPGRLVSSAKSWLSHPGVDRTAPLLPWGGPPDVPRLSPLEVSTQYLKHIVAAWNHAHAQTPENRLEDQQIVLTVPASFDDVARNLTAEAAKQAGLQHVLLLEEPQAAFYAWLGTHTPQEAGQLKPGMRCLVVDVGGGTTDLSLIRVGEDQGEITFERDAVGDHLLLGGDNMDLALAKAVEAKLPAGRLDAAQFGALIQACRQAKESLLSPQPPASVPVTVMGRGRSVIGGAISRDITADDVTNTLFEGFFPAVPFETQPTRAARSALQEMGLPYVSDAAITRHLAAFLREHLPNREPVDAILFNGGVFSAKALQDRLIAVMRPWFETVERPWNPLVLTTPSLDLAVAWGAAYFGWLKQSGGRRIGGGIPRSYYLGIEAQSPPPASDATTTISVLCVVPRGLQEGEEIRLADQEMELAIGQPVLFPLFTSTVRGDDTAGTLLHLPPSALLQLPPLHTMLRGGKRAGTKRVPVTLLAKATEIGTLELYCVSREGNRWRLEFNVRDVVRDTPRRDEDTAEASRIVDVFPEEKVEAAAAQMRAAFTRAGSPTPQQLPKALETALESSRGDWPMGLCRRLWDYLTEVSDQRASSPAHLSRWYNLTGFCLRPGFGDPLDRYRVEALWKLITSAASATTPTNQPTIPEGGADYWIMWRRISGGLNTARQLTLWTRLRPALLPTKTKGFLKPSVNELAEMWRTAASLERLDIPTKRTLGETLLGQLQERPPSYLFWSLTRLGARKLLYGPLNTIVHPATVEQWLEQLLRFTPASDQDRLGWGFCLAQLARQTGLRGLDVSQTVQARVIAALQAAQVPPAWVQMVEEVIHDATDDQSRLFGEGLPIGLRLTGAD
ncbi:MAG: hsp70 family protein [Bacteroidales bacterium]|nr:hsp70 family protein [Bacteroidales bacterium]